MNVAAISTVLAQLDREVWLVTAAAGERRGGLIATSVVASSIVPESPRMLVGIGRHQHTWELIEASDAFALHLLTEEHLSWVWHFGLQSGRSVDKMAGHQVSIAATRSPILSDALGWLDCRVEARLDTGDRSVYLAEVVEGKMERMASPLTLRRLLQLAPPERLRELKEQAQAGSAIEAEAIRRWRRQKASTPIPPKSS